MLQGNPRAVIDLSVWVDVGNLNPADVSPIINCGNSAPAQTDRPIAVVKMTVSHNGGTETPSKNTPPLLGSSSNVHLKEEEEDDRDNLISVWNEIVRSKRTEKAVKDPQRFLPKDKASRSTHKLTHLHLLSIGIGGGMSTNYHIFSPLKMKRIG